VVKAEDAVVEEECSVFADEYSIIVERVEGAVLPAALVVFELLLGSETPHFFRELEPKGSQSSFWFSISQDFDRNMGLLGFSDVVCPSRSSVGMLCLISTPLKAFCSGGAA
jgi:hypothetical protein